MNEVPILSGPTTLRLWDKDFNLLVTWNSGANLYFTEDDEHGVRRSGLVKEIHFTNDDDVLDLLGDE